MRASVISWSPKLKQRVLQGSSCGACTGTPRTSSRLACRSSAWAQSQPARWSWRRGTRRHSCLRVGEHTLSPSDVVVADDDGAVFLPDDRVAEVLDVAAGIRDTERRQAERIHGGTTLRQQVEFASFLENRKRNAKLTLREHLRAVGGSIEE
jgi:hypothetical protein